jgi:hypothetical protein
MAGTKKSDIYVNKEGKLRWHGFSIEGLYKRHNVGKNTPIENLIIFLTYGNIS